jgi:hypothetical protein
MSFLGFNLPNMDTIQLTLAARNRGFIETEEELKACEQATREPRMSREVYNELNRLISAYKGCPDDAA